MADILKDTTYTGTLTQHRTTRFSYKNHKVLNVPESERIVRENAHEAIIDRQTWDKVQAINNSVSRGRHDKANMVHPLSGLLICPIAAKSSKAKAAGEIGFICTVAALM